jgi:hypothetical protein
VPPEIPSARLYLYASMGITASEIKGKGFLTVVVTGDSRNVCA